MCHASFTDDICTAPLQALLKVILDCWDTEDVCALTARFRLTRPEIIDSRAREVSFALLGSNT